MTEHDQEKVIGHVFDWMQGVTEGVPIYIPAGQASDLRSDRTEMRFGLTLFESRGQIHTMQYVVFPAAIATACGMSLAMFPDGEIIVIPKELVSAWDRRMPIPPDGRSRVPMA
jgi:hypothetical protein